MDADAVEIRVLGCLIEKQRTTPDQYPLSLNALRLACNQATNRDPVVDYDEATVRAALLAEFDLRWPAISRSIREQLLAQGSDLAAALAAAVAAIAARARRWSVMVKPRQDRVDGSGQG